MVLYDEYEKLMDCQTASKEVDDIAVQYNLGHTALL